MSGIMYKGTRNNKITATASEAILKGICSDGGLFIPESIPVLDKKLEDLQKLNYKDLAFEILKHYVDFTDEELKACIDGAYDSKFDCENMVEVVKKGDAMFLELFHGKTLAFKDMALSILPYFMKTAMKRQGIDKEVVILTATSGDTGKAALEGFANIDGIKIIVFFPDNGVSPVQRLQMVTQEGENTKVVGILGNFDDAQSAVKSIFTDEELQKDLEDNGYVFSSANSINIGRLIPQIVYYFYAYFKAVELGEIKMNDKLNFSVPTGNFGDILAGWYAGEMGLPVGELICASNDNKVLYDFFQSYTYDRNRDFHVTVSPSMDILISSNLERLISHKLGHEFTKEAMDNLNSKGIYSINDDNLEKIKSSGVKGAYASKDETFASIKGLFDETGYVMDTHTAVGYAGFKKYASEFKDNTPMVIVSTASPYKFTKDVMIGLGMATESDEDFDLMCKLESISKVEIPNPIKNLETRPVLHSDVWAKEDIKKEVKNFLLKK